MADLAAGTAGFCPEALPVALLNSYSKQPVPETAQDLRHRQAAMKSLNGSSSVMHHSGYRFMIEMRQSWPPIPISPAPGENPNEFFQLRLARPIRRHYKCAP